MSKSPGTLSSLAIRRPIGTLAVGSVVVVLGAYFGQRLPIDLLPQIVYPQIRASVSYPGVAPEVLEEQVTKVLETNLATTENLSRLESETIEGRSAVNLYFRYGTDMNFALQDASKNLDRARSRLPEDSEPPTIFKFDPAQIPVYEVGFSSPLWSMVDLRRWVDLQLLPQLLTIEGVASIDVAGGLVREVHVTLDQERLRSYGLTLSDVLDALRDENQDVAAGNITSESFEVVGKTTGKFASVEDIEAVLLTVGSSQRIPLSEVASVADTNRVQRLWSRLNGVPAVKLSVRKLPEANTVAVADGVGHLLDQLASSRFIPGEVEYRVVADQSFFIKSAVGSVRNAALIGALLAMTVVFLFLGSLRKTFIVGLSIPMAVLATLVMMGLTGLTINIMALGGLALGVGMLVDNSIVMLENIFRHRSQGATDPETAAHQGSAEVTSAVVAATLTNLAAVVPFLLISGLAALIFRELILTISFAIVAALVVALTLVPMLAAQLAKVRWSSHLAEWGPLRWFHVGLDRATEAYRPVARATLRHRGLVVVGAFGLLVLALGFAGRLPSEFLPQVDDGNMRVFIRMPPGTPPEQTNQVVLDLEGLIKQQPYVRDVFATAGGFLFGGSTSQRGGRGSINVLIAPVTERPDMPAGLWVANLQRQIDSLAIPGAQIGVRPPRIRGLRTNISGSDVAVSVQGDDLPTLQQLAAEVVDRIRGIPGLEGIELSTEEASPQLSITIDRQRAGDMGLSVAEVGQTVRTALEGSTPTRFTDGTNEYDIRVRLPREQFRNASDLGSIAMFPGLDRPIYLRDVAAVKLATGPTTILRENQSRQIRVTADVNDAIAPTSQVNREIRARLATLGLPDGFTLLYGGEEEAIRENNRNLMIVIGLAVFLVFVVLAVQYESVADPLVILVSIPLSLIGVATILTLTTSSLSAPVLLGVILLAGIVVNNAILLVEYVEIGRRAGLNARDAIVEAGAVRLRPILMTTLTTVLGMLPLALGIGQGTELMQPLAIAVVGGLTVSALLTLLVVPSVYLLMGDLTDRLRTFVTGQPRPIADS